MADKLLDPRSGEPTGMNWAQRFLNRSVQLKMTFIQVKDRQRALQEDPEVVPAWFRLIKETIAKYDIQDADIHNFDETGFQMGVIGSLKVVTASERRNQPQLIQPGDREWITVIQGSCAAGYAITPFIIYKGRVHISAWYEESGIPLNWRVSDSENE
ncbi:hypothetical protein K3495_g9258 [Podosphaera aphanis]|nr:hypothetical protein K3495_g9258 [Podosphaera aphanis]